MTTTLASAGSDGAATADFSSSDSNSSPFQFDQPSGAAAAGDLLLICDCEGNLRFRNHAWRSSAQNLPPIGKPFFEMLSQPFRKTARRALESLGRGKVAMMTFDCRLAITNEPERVFEARFQTDEQSDGSKLVFASFRDVSAERAESANLASQLGEARRVLETMPMCLWRTDLKHRLLEVNESAAKLFGIDPVVLGGGYFELELDALTSDENQSNSEIRGMIACIPNAKGEERRFLVDKLSQPGAKGGWIYFAQDISEQLLAESQLHERDTYLAELTSELPLMVWTIDRDCRIRSAHGELFASLGFEAAELVGKRIEPGAAAGSLPEFMSHPLAGMALAGEKAATNFQFHNRHFRLSFRPLRDESGEVKGCIGVAHDESRLVLARRDAESAREELDRKAAFNEQFVSTMSHELRTPLNAVLGASEMLLVEMLGALNPEQEEAALAIRSGGKHMLELLNGAAELLGLQRFEPRLSPGPLLLAPLLRSCFQGEVMTQAHRKGQTLEIEIDPEVESVFADEDRFRQIMFNVISHAIHATPEGERIVLGFEGMPEDAKLRLTVRSASREELDASANWSLLKWGGAAALSGSGLQLGLAMMIAEALGGELRIQPADPGYVDLRLPWPKAVQGAYGVKGGELASFETPKTKFVGLPAASEVSRDRETRILIADDDEVNRRLLYSYLSSWGYRLSVASDGVEALEKAGADQPDVILMDLCMPRMNGFDAICALRRNPVTAGAPIFALTGLSEQENRERCLEAGATDHISKPYDFADLVETIERHLKPAPPGAGAALAA